MLERFEHGCSCQQFVKIIVIQSCFKSNTYVKLRASMKPYIDVCRNTNTYIHAKTNY